MIVTMLICLYLLMVVIVIARLKIATLSGVWKLNWPTLIMAGIGWPITTVVILWKSVMEDDKPAAICSRCHGEIEGIEHVQSGEDYGLGVVCEGCFRFLQNYPPPPETQEWRG
jgi:hypothetical protein